MGNNASNGTEPGRSAREGGESKAVAHARGEGPDVHLDVPNLKVDEISLEVENLEAHVSQVLDMLRLNVGADVFLGKVKLEIKGVEAQALLDVRLDNVAVIVDRVLTTLDRNPELLQHIGRGVEAAAGEIGAGTGKAVGEIGEGAGGAVKDVGEGAGGAVKDVGEGAGGAVKDVGEGTGTAAENVGEGAGGAAKSAGEGAGGAAKSAGEGAGGAAQSVGEDAGGAVKDAGEGARDVGKGAGDTAASAVSDTAETAEPVTEQGQEQASDQDGETGEKPPLNGDDGNGEKGGTGGPEATALHDALQETEQSVRELGKALFRMFTQQTGRGGD